MVAPAGTLSVVDYERIARCMTLTGAVWLEVAELGLKAGLVHWKVAGICRTIAAYAAGGWERKPTAKQAKPALDAAIVVQRAGLVETGLEDQETGATS